MIGTKKIFKKDPRKTYIRKIRIYPRFMYARLDKWLKKMSLSGWHIVHCGLFSFWFEKGNSAEKEYFTYGDNLNESYYSIGMRHPFLEKRYGVNKKKSKINANESRSHRIVEIDRQKIDYPNNVDYQELINDRNRLYSRYFLRNFIFVAIVIAISLCLIFCR